MDEGNLLGALPWFAEALRLDQGDPGREEIHRIRLGAVLRQCPRLIQVWDETELAQFSPDGQRVVTAHRQGKTARIWDATSGQPLTAPRRLEEGIADVAFQGQRCHAVTANGKEARIWDVVSGEPMTPPLMHDSQVQMASFSPDGCYVATWCADNTVRVWEGTRCRLVARLLNLSRVPGGEPRDIAPNAGSLKPWFSADSRRLLLLSDEQVQVWDVAKGRLITTLRDGRFSIAALSPDGGRLATAAPLNPLVSLWDVNNGGRHIGMMVQGRLGPINGLSFSPDGRHLVTAGNDGTAQVRDTATGQPLAPPLKQGTAINGVWFSPDGRQVLTASNDGTVQVSAAATGQPVAPPLLHGQAVDSAAFSPDGHRVLTWAVAPGGSRVLRLWDMAPAETAPRARDPLAVFSQGPMEVGYQNCRDRIGIAHLKGQPVRVWDWDTCQPLSAPLNLNGPVWYVEFSRDRSRLLTLIRQLTVSADKPGAVMAQVWDPATGQPVGPPQPVVPPGYPPNAHAHSHLSPDGRRMVTMNRQGTTEIWDVASGQPLGPPLKSASDPRFGQDATFSPDGRWVVIREDDTVRLWDGAAPHAVTLLPRHSGTVEQASFSPDSRRLVTASRDGTARVWDVAAGQLLCAPLRHGSAVLAAAFSADGRLVATGSEDDKMIRAWDAATGEPVTPRVRNGVQKNCSPQSLNISAAGYHLLTLDSCGVEREWDLSPEGRPLEDLISFTEVLSGHRINATSGLVPLERERFQRVWTELCARYPQSFASSPQTALAWHAEQVDACQQGHQWAATVWHLDHLIAAEPKQWRHQYDRGRASAQLKQWEQAIADHSSAIELGGEERWMRLERGNAYAVRGQWDKAAADYARAAEAWPTGSLPDLLYPHTLLRLTVDDAKGYRQACRKLLDRSSTTSNPARWVWACLLAGDALDDYGPLLELARKAVTINPHDYAYARTLGGALLRAGRLQAAVQQLQKASSLDPSTSLLLAMAHHHLGHADEARQWLDKAVQQIEQVLRQRPKNAGTEATALAPDEFAWTERLSLQLLRRDAEALIRGPAAKGKVVPAEKK
jgi:WD40 repeat protein/tetratricopeptide (TPR) repeat protein